MIRVRPFTPFPIRAASLSSRPGSGPSLRNSLAHVREMFLSSSQEELSHDRF